jgi:hypothetical protein
MFPERKLQKVSGRASLTSVRHGTASEHTGLVLDTAEGERLVLIRLGANPFEVGQHRQLAGQNVEVEGYRVGNEMRYTAIRSTSDDV